MTGSGIGRRLLGLLGPVFVGLLVGVLGLELLARLSWEEDWQDPSRTGIPEDAEGLPEFEGILELARPNLRGTHRNVYHRTNSKGIRGPEYTKKPAPGTFRILVTGDSTTMGSGVLETERYTDRLSEWLGERYEVVNIGLSGLNIAAVMNRLARHSQHYESHLFVYGFSLNDIEGPAYRTKPTELPPGDFGRFYWSFIEAAERSPSYLYRYLIQWRLASLVTGKGHSDLLDNFLNNPPAWQDFAKGLSRFAALSRRRGVCGHVLIHTHLDQLDEGHVYLEVYDRIEQAALARGLTVTQPFDDLVEHAPKRAKALWVSLFDPHPNRRAHALLAEALKRDLEALPPECWPRR